jgi:hypothetical protein
VNQFADHLLVPVGLLDFEGPLVTMRVAVVTVLVVIMVVVLRVVMECDFHLVRMLGSDFCLFLMVTM